MRVIDTHAHFWDIDRLDYPWIEAGSPFDRSFLPEDYRQAAAGRPIEAIVFVECDAAARCSVAEADWVAALARADPRIQAIVARVSMLEDGATATLAALADRPLVRGIRDNIQGHKPGFALQEAFVRGVQAAFARGLHFELCLTHDQLDEAIALVRLCPDGQFVLDHCAKPDIAADQREPWQSQMQEMARLPNVVCKISGLVTEADWDDRQAGPVLRYARAAVEAFGADRVMFGSDWPINEVAGGFSRWFDLAETLASSWAQGDRDAFFQGNAERIYRLTRVAEA